jgi:hypothetical protein
MYSQISIKIQISIVYTELRSFDEPFSCLFRTRLYYLGVGKEYGDSKILTEGSEHVLIGSNVGLDNLTNKL